MIKKPILLITLFIFLVIFIVSFLYYSQSNISSKIKNLIPMEIKENIKQLVFLIPELNKKSDQHYNALKKANRDIAILQNKLNEFIISDLKDNKAYKIKPIISKISKKENIFHYTLPFPNYYLSKKPGFYIDEYNDKFLLFTGTGQSFIIDKNFHENREIDLKYIENNLKEVINDQNFFDIYQSNKHSYSISIKDIKIINEDILISYTKKISENCYNTSILKSKIAEKLTFDELFSYNDCVKFFSEFAGVQSGGRIEYNKSKNVLYFTIGDYRNRPLAQNSDSYFGKIIRIEYDSLKHDIYSIGHRNPQGLHYVNNKNILISTEHGPYGGDEINIIEFNENYGWPISSYGNHYDGSFKSEAPLHKSHKNYGFKEPVFNWSSVSSIGVSEIVSIDDDKNIFFVSTLRSKKGFIIDFNEDFTEYKIIYKYEIGERIRDVLYDKKQNLIYLSLENSPALGVIDAKEFSNIYSHQNKLWKWDWSIF